MKVLFITGNFPPISGVLNGGALVAVRQIRSLVREGVCCGIFNGETVTSEIQGVLRKCKWDNISAWSFSVAGRRDPNNLTTSALVKALKQVCAEFSPDLIHVFQYEFWHGHLGEALEQIGLPVVFTALDYGFLCARSTLINGKGELCDGYPDRWKCSSCLTSARTPLAQIIRRTGRFLPNVTRQWPLIGRIARDAFSNRKRLHEALKNWPVFSKLVSAWIAPSKVMYEALNKNGLPTEKIFHIPYGYDSPVPRIKKADDGLVTFGYAGRFVYEKGFHLLTEAFAKTATECKNAKLLLFGSQSEVSGYYASDAFLALKPFEDRVMWGTFDGSDEKSVSFAHLEIDCMVVPSIWWDNLPLTVVESLANGTPVIASAHTSASEPIINGQNGLIFDCFIKNSLAEQMIKFSSDRELRLRLLAATSYERSYRDETHNIIAIYSKCIKSALV